MNYNSANKDLCVHNITLKARSHYKKAKCKPHPTPPTHTEVLYCSPSNQ